MSGMADDLTPLIDEARSDMAALAGVTDTEALFTMGDYEHLASVARNRLNEEQQKNADYRRLLAAAVDAAGGELRFDLDDMDLLNVDGPTLEIFRQDFPPMVIVRRQA